MQNIGNIIYDFNIYQSINEVPVISWELPITPKKLFLSYSYLKALEAAAPPGMLFRYIIFYENAKPVGIGIVQIIKITHNTICKKSKLKHFSNIQSKQSLSNPRGLYLLICGNGTISGEYGLAFLPEIDTKKFLKSLTHVMNIIKKSFSYKILLIGSIIKEIKTDLIIREEITKNKYNGFDPAPNMIVPDVNRWLDFNQYQQSMKKKYQRRTRSALKKGAPLFRKDLTLNEIISEKTRIFNLYLQVHIRSSFRMITLNPDIFSEWKKQLGKYFTLSAYYIKGKMLAFTTRFFSGDIMEGYTHGIDVAMDIEVNADQTDDMGVINRYVLSGDLVAGRVTTTVHADDGTTDARSWYHLDHLNSTKSVTDESEEVEVSYVYRAFGEQLKKLGEGDAKYTYGGKELDDNTNLYYFNARYYDATTGRFINVDPVQDGSNWYGS